ncbi:MAG: bacillithiol biosynthesis BshC, partial [bacterium]|nr:bacillithiol biosynthesis BshC [bacterium]
MSQTATVVTGQQIGLLGGPLYTVYKVLGAAHLAGKLNGNAVYWLETNDADFNEINHIDYLDAQGQLKT